MGVVSLDYSKRKFSGGDANSPVLMTVSSGKGGVGKSFFVSSVGITLSKLGYRVCIVDFDLLSPNLHTFFSISPKIEGLASYKMENKAIHQLPISTNISKLDIILGHHYMWKVPQYNSEQLEEIVVQLKKLPYDIVILDTACGACENNRAFFEKSDEVVFVTTPEPTAIENLYRMLETLSVNLVTKNLSTNDSDAFIKKLYKDSHNNNGLPFSLQSIVEKDFPEYKKFLQSRSYRFVVNNTRSYEDEILGLGMKSVARKYLGMQLDYLGLLRYDNAVWQCVRSKVPVLIHQPFTPLVGDFTQIAREILDLCGQSTKVAA